MRIGVSSYSFIRKLWDGSYTLFDTVSKAKEIGFDCIEFINHWKQFDIDGISTPETAVKLKELADREGIAVSAFTVNGDLVNGIDGDQGKEIERIKSLVDIGEILGVKLLRHDVAPCGFFGENKRKSYREAIDYIVPAIREITEYAASKGIATMSENHGHFMQDSTRMEKLVRAVNHPNYGILADIGNFLCVDEDPLRALGVVGPYVRHVHVKDFLIKDGRQTMLFKPWDKTRGGNYIRGTIAGHGVVPVKQCIDLLKGHFHYGGVFSLEFEGMEDVITGIETGYGMIKACLE